MSLPSGAPNESPPIGPDTSVSSSYRYGLSHVLATLGASAPSLILGWRVLPDLSAAFLAAVKAGDWKISAVTGVPLFFLLLPLGVGVEIVTSLSRALAKRIAP